MDVSSSSNKRGANPETTIEPRGKAGRPKDVSKQELKEQNAEQKEMEAVQKKSLK